jgi:hypothetical protein
MSDLLSNFSNLVNSRMKEAAADVYRVQIARRNVEGDKFQRSEHAENIILHNLGSSYLYARDIVGGAWPAFESAAVDRADTLDELEVRMICNYATGIKGQRIQALEERLLEYPEISERYFHAFGLAEEFRSRTAEKKMPSTSSFAYSR